MRVENHLLGLARVSHHKHLPAESQPEMRDFDGLHDAAELDVLMAPIELAHLAGRKDKRNKGLGDGGAGFGRLPPPHEALHAVIGAAIPLTLQSFEQPPAGAALGFREGAFGVQPGLQRLLEGAKHRRRLLTPLVARLIARPAMLANRRPRQLQVHAQSS